MKTITAGGKQYELYWTYGRVEESGKNMETKVSGGGGGGATFGGYGGTAPVNIRSHTVVHDQIFLTDPKGNEHAFQLQGMNVACRSGNQLSVLWAVEAGQKKGPYIAVYNHTTSQSFFEKMALNKMFRRNGWYVLAAMAACLILGRFINLLYWGILLLPIAWIIEGTMAAKKFREETNFKEFV